MKNYNKAIGRWLYNQRKARGLHQQDIADALGVTKSAVSLWELGKRVIYAETLLQYCDALGVDPSLLLEDLKKEPYASL